MIVTTKAIVLSSVKYGESDLIVKCYTEEGVKAYMLKRILRSKKGRLKIAYFQPLTLLELVANHNSKGNLNFIKEVKINHPYQTISSNVIKQTIILFLSEVLTKSLFEEEKNTQLFKYLETSLIWFDTHNNVSNFHLLFLLNLTKHLGFYPKKEMKEYLFFNLQEGKFSLYKPIDLYIQGETLTCLKMLLGINFEGLDKLKFNVKNRHAILDALIQYFELHLPGFNKPKSLTVLKSVFV